METRLSFAARIFCCCLREPWDEAKFVWHNVYQLVLEIYPIHVVIVMFVYCRFDTWCCYIGLRCMIASHKFASHRKNRIWYIYCDVTQHDSLFDVTYILSVIFLNYAYTLPAMLHSYTVPTLILYYTILYLPVNILIFYLSKKLLINLYIVCTSPYIFYYLKVSKGDTWNIKGRECWVAGVLCGV